MTQHLQMKALDDDLFTRSQSGAIWGRVYFEVGDGAFPDSGWTDLVVGFSTAWLEALIRIRAQPVTRQRIWFMDGPFAIDVSASGSGPLSVALLHREVVKQSTEANPRDLLENAIAVGQQVLASCQKRGWTDRDVDNLEAVVQRGIDVLRGVKGSA